jgi:hypothetical protein
VLGSNRHTEIVALHRSAAIRAEPYSPSKSATANEPHRLARVSATEHNTAIRQARHSTHRITFGRSPGRHSGGGEGWEMTLSICWIRCAYRLSSGVAHRCSPASQIKKRRPEGRRFRIRARVAPKIASSSCDDATLSHQQDQHRKSTKLAALAQRQAH